MALRLATALDKAGYAELSWYSAPGGFALVTRMEQMNADGTPKGPGARWSLQPQRGDFSLGEYIRALFTAPPGHFRVIAFIVTDQPLSFSEEPARWQQVLRWMQRGSPTLPPEVAEQKFTARHQSYALIYEFERAGADTAPIFVEQSALDTRQHLAKSGLLATLGGLP